jgi:hypothetical protein
LSQFTYLHTVLLSVVQLCGATVNVMAPNGPMLSNL